MRRLLRTTTAAAFLAIAAGGAARADSTVYSTIPSDLSGVSEAVYCNASSTESSCAGGTGESIVYSSFTLGRDATVTGFDYYSYFVNSIYQSTNWWIYSQTGSSLTLVDSSGATPAAGVCSLAGETACSAATASSADPSLVSVTGLDLSLSSGATYWIALQNNIVTAPVVPSGQSSLSLYATTGATECDTFVGGVTSTVGVSCDSSWPGFGQAAVDILGGDRSSARSLPVDSPLSAPEPSTWALMLAGFAGTAWAARRRLVRPAA